MESLSARYHSTDVLSGSMNGIVKPQRKRSPDSKPSKNRLLVVATVTTELAFQNINEVRLDPNSDINPMDKWVQQQRSVDIDPLDKIAQIKRTDWLNPLDKATNIDPFRSVDFNALDKVQFYDRVVDFVSLNKIQPDVLWLHYAAPCAALECISTPSIGLAIGLYFDGWCACANPFSSLAYIMLHH